MSGMNAVRHGTARAAVSISILAALSPFSGAILEFLLARLLGLSPGVDAYRATHVLLMFTHQIFYVTLMPNILVPMVAGYRMRKGDDEAWRLAFGIGAAFLFLSVLFALFASAAPQILVSLLGPGLTGAAGRDAVFLVRIFALSMVLSSLSGVICSLLYSYGIYILSLVARIIVNLVGAAALGFFHARGGIRSLGYGILAASFVILLLHLYMAWRMARSRGISASSLVGFMRSRGLREFLQLCFPQMGIILAGQIAGVVVNRQMNLLGPGVLALYGYGIRMTVLTSIFPLSIATAIFPRIADSASRRNPGEVSALVDKSLRMASFVGIPLISLLFLLRGDLFGFLFGVSAADSAGVRQAAMIFSILLLQVPVAGILLISEKTLYSLGIYSHPFYVLLLRAAALIIVLPPIARSWGSAGIVWTWVAMSWVGGIGMLLILGMKLRGLNVVRIVAYVMELFLLAIFMAGAGTILSLFLDSLTLSPPLGDFVRIVSMGLLCVLGTGLFCWIFRIEEMRVLTGYLFRRSGVGRKAANEMPQHE